MATSAGSTEPIRSHRIERGVHRGGGEVAMQEQHLNERPRPGAVTETAAGTLPEALVRGAEATA